MPRKYTPEQRIQAFWAKVHRPSEGCWEWQAYTHHGYGRFGMPKRRIEHAHRVAWELTNGPIPAGMHVLHKCDNRLCCRPDHLFLGTNLDNIKDMLAKGRNHPPTSRKGEHHHSSKLIESDIHAIRAAYPATSLQALSRQYGVTPRAIRLVVHRVTWKHVA